MRTPLRTSLPGATILSMYVNHPATKDLIYHTWKHFLNPLHEQDWLQTHPRSATAPGTFLSRARRARINPAAFHGTCEDPRWWNHERLRIALQAHDYGYWPRIVCLLARAGLPVQPGGAWQRQKQHGPRRHMAMVGSMTVAGDWNARRNTFSVITAFQRPVFARQREGPAPAHNAFARLQRLLENEPICPPLPPPCVQGDGPAFSPGHRSKS